MFPAVAQITSAEEPNRSEQRSLQVVNNNTNNNKIKSTAMNEAIRPDQSTSSSNPCHGSAAATRLQVLPSKPIDGNTFYTSPLDGQIQGGPFTNNTRTGYDITRQHQKGTLLT